MDGIIGWIKEVLGVSEDQHGQYYVYELKDKRYSPPRVFYVGSGEGDRMYQHEKDARRLLARGLMMRLSCKHKRMVEIWDAGLEVDYDIVFRSDSRCDAYRVESEYIQRTGLERLTNETYGYSRAAIKRCKEEERVRLSYQAQAAW